MGKINVGGKSAVGDALVGDVLLNKTFSNATAPGLVGTMPNNGAVSITPSTSAQSVAAGYHNGSGSVDGDADLVSANIKSGANIFGVAGDSNVVDTASGDAVAGEILATKKAWVDGSEVTGSMTDRTTGTFTGDAIAKSGNYLRFGIPGDAFYGNAALIQYLDNDWIEGNIKSGVNVFGKTGTYSPIVSVQRGVKAIISDSHTETIGSVNLDTTIVRILGKSAYGTSVNIDPWCLEVEVTDSTTVTFTRVSSSDDLYVAYEVVEFDSDINVQKISFSFTEPSSSVNKNYTISAVDMDKSMVFGSFYYNDDTGALADDGLEELLMYELTTTTNVNITATEGNGTYTGCFYVVEL